MGKPEWRFAQWSPFGRGQPSRRNGSVKTWARPPAGLSSMPTEQRTKRPPPSGLGQRAEMRPVVSERWGRFARRVEGFRGWPVGRVVPLLRWWLSGDTGAMWLDRRGEHADRLFFHTLTEQLQAVQSAERVSRSVYFPNPRKVRPPTWSRDAGLLFNEKADITRRPLSFGCIADSRRVEVNSYSNTGIRSKRI